jgi:hypothetical protein
MGVTGQDRSYLGEFLDVGDATEGISSIRDGRIQRLGLQHDRKTFQGLQEPIERVEPTMKWLECFILALEMSGDFSICSQ